MPQRKVPLVNNEYYHVFNRSINKEPIFVKNKDCQRVINTLEYYRFEEFPIRLSYFLALGVDRRQDIMQSLIATSRRVVDIISFVIMPNHFHFLLRQGTDGGISKFLALIQNSYTKYFNNKHTRQGHLFQGQFKSVRVEDDEQLLHINRYIHLNPYTSFIIKSPEELESYPYSSFHEYINRGSVWLCDTEAILSHFASRAAYKKFVFDQADYQRKLEVVKHLILE